MEGHTENCYFITKCGAFEDLKKAIESGVWACRPGVCASKLEEAWQGEGQVVLIFSVTGQHGYHGYATMGGPPGSVTTAEKDEWLRFSITWGRHLWPEFGERCLPASATKHLVCSDGTPINKARNMQQLSPAAGDALCSLITLRREELKQQANAKLQAQTPPPWVSFSSPSDVSSCWSELLSKVERELGPVVLACPYGSTRYNLALPGSDEDMFVVYLASTRQLLSFCPPPLTLKSREHESPDYHVLELRRFCELALGGDPKMAEVLFVPQHCFRASSATLTQLQKWREKFLCRELVEKYLRDACGAKGLKHLEKILSKSCGGKKASSHQKPRHNKAGPADSSVVPATYSEKTERVSPSQQPAASSMEAQRRNVSGLSDQSGESLEASSQSVGSMESQVAEGKECEDVMDEKAAKLLYVIVRLLFNARDIVIGGGPVVWREEGSEGYRLLMNIRRKRTGLADTLALVHSLRQKVSASLDSSSLPPDCSAVKADLEKWLVDLRLHDCEGSEAGKAE